MFTARTTKTAVGLGLQAHEEAAAARAPRAPEEETDAVLLEEAMRAAELERIDSSVSGPRKPPVEERGVARNTQLARVPSHFIRHHG